jgi:acyl-CoA dehydrogenase
MLYPPGGITVDFAYSEKAKTLQKQLSDFMDHSIYPNEQTYRQQIAASGNSHHHAEIVDELKEQARKQGQWNLFLPDQEYSTGLTNLEYAPLSCSSFDTKVIFTKFFNGRLTRPCDTK